MLADPMSFGGRFRALMIKRIKSSTSCVVGYNFIFISQLAGDDGEEDDCDKSTEER